MNILLKRDTAFEITDIVIERVFTKQVILLLLQEHQKEFRVTLEILQIIAKKFDKDVMTLLLYERRSMITITNAIVQAAAGNARYSLEMMKLEKRGSQFYISREVIMTAARNSSSGSAVLSLLLGKRRQKIEITEKIIETVVTH